MGGKGDWQELVAPRNFVRLFREARLGKDELGKREFGKGTSSLVPIRGHRKRGFSP
jgi:hypothetical protein